jgi:hypothetical protein
MQLEGGNTSLSQSLAFPGERSVRNSRGGDPPLRHQCGPAKVPSSPSSWSTKARRPARCPPRLSVSRTRIRPAAGSARTHALAPTPATDSTENPRVRSSSPISTRTGPRRSPLPAGEYRRARDAGARVRGGHAHGEPSPRGRKPLPRCGSTASRIFPPRMVERRPPRPHELRRRLQERRGAPRALRPKPKTSTVVEESDRQQGAADPGPSLAFRIDPTRSRPPRRSSSTTRSTTPDVGPHRASRVDEHLVLPISPATCRARSEASFPTTPRSRTRPARREGSPVRAPLRRPAARSGVSRADHARPAGGRGARQRWTTSRSSPSTTTARRPSVWYRLLNTGFRIPAGAGTDAMANFAFAHAVPSGRSRLRALGSEARLPRLARSAPGRANVRDERSRSLPSLSAGREIGDEIRLRREAGTSRRG